MTPSSEQLVNTALTAVQQEFPHHLSHVLTGPIARTSRQLHPAFYGSFDWHSAVHNHWLLTYALRRWPENQRAHNIHEVLDKHLTEANLAAELHYVQQPENRSWERPYGWAWVARLDAELAVSPDPKALRWRTALGPLTQQLTSDCLTYLSALPFPVTAGTHANTAFSMTLLVEAARLTQQHDLADDLAKDALRLFGSSTPAIAPGHPSHGDFLAPYLAAADLMSLVLSTAQFSEWVDAYLPDLSELVTTTRGTPAHNDVGDPAGVHLEGLHLTTAWELHSIARALQPSDPRVRSLLTAVDFHATAGARHACTGNFTADHWIPTFVAYLDYRRQQPLP